MSDHVLRPDGEARPRVLVCNCEKTMGLDAEALSTALGQPVTASSHLCRTQVTRFEAALSGGDVCVACTQESALFSEVAEDLGYKGALSFVNIRENAGWTSDRDASAKVAALLKDAQRRETPARLKSFESEGLCLVYGEGQDAIEAAMKLSGRLSPSVLLAGNADILPPSRGDVPLARGKIRTASGHLGAFEIMVDQYAPLSPSSRSEPVWLMPRDGAQSACDIIVDMTRGPALFSGAHRRDGYFKVDPGSPVAIAEALFDASDLVGAFEKPIYVDYNPDICAHSRNQVVGCSKCLDVCPAGAISDDGDHVLIDAGICGGCGSCSAVCPSGASSYSYPQRTDLVTRLQALAGHYLEAGGVTPVLLLHDESHGQPIIDAIARFGRGLPAHVIPVGLHAVTVAGHDTLLSALASGFQHVAILANPHHAEELGGTEAEMVLTNAFAAGLGLQSDGGQRVSLIAENDPDAVEVSLWSLDGGDTIPRRTFSASANKRETARSAITALKGTAATDDIIALPDTAPYGRIHIDTDGCTLCLACVSVCPANALLDNPDRPEVRLVEAACVQCGLCQKTCPESVISLEPRFNMSPSALSPEVLNTDEPFACVECGKPFGSRQTVERISEQLAGKHSMFLDPEKSRLIQMCDDCRVSAQFKSGDNPFQGGERPRIRTTEDYLAAEKGNLAAKDFLIDED